MTPVILFMSVAQRSEHAVISFKDCKAKIKSSGISEKFQCLAKTRSKKRKNKEMGKWRQRLITIDLKGEYKQRMRSRTPGMREERGGGRIRREKMEGLMLFDDLGLEGGSP